MATKEEFAVQIVARGHSIREFVFLNIWQTHN